MWKLQELTMSQLTNWYIFKLKTFELHGVSCKMYKMFTTADRLTSSSRQNAFTRTRSRSPTWPSCSLSAYNNQVQSTCIKQPTPIAWRPFYANCIGYQYASELSSRRPCWYSNVCMACLRHTCRHIASQRHHTAVGITCALLSPANSNYGDRSFAIYRPVVWNSLPAELHLLDILLPVFRKRLKMFLF